MGKQKQKLKAVIISIICLLTVTGIILIILSGGYFLNRKKTQANAGMELTCRDAGEPYSDWGKSPTGSAKYLDGTTVLVSLFLDDTNADWTPEDRRLLKKNMDIAADYLMEVGKQYGKDVNLIYDLNEHQNLEYHIKYDQAFPGSSSTRDDREEVDDLILYVDEYIRNEIPIQEIMTEYQVNSIGFLCFVDGTASAATTYPYVDDDPIDYYAEICFINLRWTSGRNVNPDTYAHEILHLFGARDLYYTSESDGITREFVDYTAKQRSKDIMLGNARKGITCQDSIRAEVTGITAYYLGWLYYVPELEQFPSIKASYPASFSKVSDPYGNYEEYMLKSRRMYESDYYKMIVTKVLTFICWLVILRDCVIIIRKRKKKQAMQGYIITEDIEIEEEEVQ